MRNGSLPKNPKTCRLNVGDRVAFIYDTKLEGTLVGRRTYGGPTFRIRWDGRTYDDWYYRDQVLLVPERVDEIAEFFV